MNKVEELYVKQLKKQNKNLRKQVAIQDKQIYYLKKLLGELIEYSDMETPDEVKEILDTE